MNEEHELDLFWHALNYRTVAAPQLTQAMWHELLACHERLIAVREAPLRKALGQMIEILDGQVHDSDEHVQIEAARLLA
jgi:hypothetical protein